jgi:phosphoglycerate dehydrogenase-like enzyme
MSHPCAIVALSDSEIAEFLPGDLWRRLGELLPGHQRIDPLATPPADWPGLLEESPSEILVSGWKTSPLPATLEVARPGRLRYACHMTGSVRQLIPRELIERGLLVTNWGGSVSATIAESALMLILMALRRASHWSIVLHRDRAWRNEDAPTGSLVGRCVGIHGFGNIARALVPMLQPLTSNIQAFSAHVPDELFRAAGVRRVNSLESLFATSDVVVELSAGIARNRHVVTEELLRRIPEGAVFVNVGRGSVVDEAALARVAREGRLNVALDVFETEPLPADSPLRGLPNVTLSPHLAGPANERRRDAGVFALGNLEAYRSGRALSAVVNLEVYDRAT